jgi:hypothetical protein
MIDEDVDLAFVSGKGKDAAAPRNRDRSSSMEMWQRILDDVSTNDC